MNAAGAVRIVSHSLARALGPAGDPCLTLSMVTEPETAGVAVARFEPKLWDAVERCAAALREAPLFAKPEPIALGALSITEWSDRAAWALVDAARVDACCRALGLPLHLWLGGAVRNSIPIAVEIDDSAADSTLDDLVRRRGVRRLVVSLRSPRTADVVQAVARLRSRFGSAMGIGVRLDGQFEVTAAQELFGAVAPLHPEFIADPCADGRAANAALARRMPPVALSVHRYLPAAVAPTLGLAGAPVLLVDPVAVGGIDAVRALATLAALNGAELWLRAGSGEPWEVCLAAQLASICPGADQPLVVPARAFAAGAFGERLSAGAWPVPTSHGIGWPAAATGRGLGAGFVAAPA
jgi:L-alanine-DL-glutamate epimerase-like enolase superfamily enzyme